MIEQNKLQRYRMYKDYKVPIKAEFGDYYLSSEADEVIKSLADRCETLEELLKRAAPHIQGNMNRAEKEGWSPDLIKTGDDLYLEITETLNKYERD